MGVRPLSTGDGRPGVRVFYGSSRGGKTLDQGEGGGNPFASALIDLLERPGLTLGALSDEIVSLTEQKSSGFQIPETPSVDGPARETLVRPPARGAHPALVLVVADYTAGGAPSLPGAVHDAGRVAAALRSAGFRTMTVIDPTRAAAHAVLEEFAVSSAVAETAIIYTTGHGVDVDGKVYLLPGDYPVKEGNAGLPERAIRLDDVRQRMRARRENLLFYAGCRDDPLGTPRP